MADGAASGGRQGPGRPRSASRPRSAGSRGAAPEGAGLAATANPFAAGNAHFLQQEKLRSTVGGRLPAGRPASGLAAGGPRASRRREHELLQMLDRLEEKDTLELGVRQLREVLDALQTADELAWFLRVVFDERRPLASSKARREQLLLLPRVAGQLGAASAPPGALEGRVLPCLSRALKGPESEEVVTRAACEILERCAPLSEDSAGLDFLDVCPAVLRAFLDPLVLGSGTDLATRRRCVQVLGGVTSTMLAGVEALGRNGAAAALLEGHATSLVQCLAANPTLQEGLLQCLAQMAASGGESVLSHAHCLVELCATHLLETPSATPSYAALQQPSGIPEDPLRLEQCPKRGTLTRKLALVCCSCLAHLGDNAAPLMPEGQGLERHRPAVEAALGRENLNLQRLTCSNEPLRRTIARAWQAWQDLGGGPRVHAARARDGSADSHSPSSGPRRHDRSFSKNAQTRSLALPAIQDPAASGNGRPYQRCLSPHHRRGRLPPHRPHAHRAQPGPTERRRQSVGRPAPRAAARQERGSARRGEAPAPEGGGDGEEGSLQPEASVRSDRTDDSSNQRSQQEGQRPPAHRADAEGDEPDPAEPESPEEEAHHEQPAAVAAEPGGGGGAEPTAGRRAARWRRGRGRGQEEGGGEPEAVASEEGGGEPGGGAAERASRGASGERFPPSGYAAAGSLPPLAALQQPRARKGAAGPMRAGPAAAGGAGPLGNAAGAGPVPYAAEPWPATGGPPSAPATPPPAPGEPAPAEPVLAPVAAPPPQQPLAVSAPLCPQEVALQEEEEEEEARAVQELVGPLPPESQAPGLMAAVRHAVGGRFGDCFQCVFRLGNERTLRDVLERLEPPSVWLKLSEEEARYLAHLLVLLLCKDPTGSAGHQACQWLDGLAGLRGGAELIELEDLAALQRALFCRSGNSGEDGRHAAMLYCQLSQAATASG